MNEVVKTSPSEVFLGKYIMKIYNKPAGEHAEVQSNFIEFGLRHGWSPVNLQQIFRVWFNKNTSGGLLLSDLKPNCKSNKHLL